MVVEKPADDIRRKENVASVDRIHVDKHIACHVEIDAAVYPGNRCTDHGDDGGADGLISAQGTACGTDCYGAEKKGKSEVSLTEFLEALVLDERVR